MLRLAVHNAWLREKIFWIKNMYFAKHNAREKKNKNMISHIHTEEEEEGPTAQITATERVDRQADLLNAREKHTYVQTNKKGKAYSRLDYAYVSNDLSEQTLSYNIDYSANYLTTFQSGSRWTRTQFEMKISPQQRKDQTSEQSQKNNGAEDKQGTSSIYKVNIDRDKVLNELKRQEREIRTQYNKDITINFEKLKSKRKEIKRRQKEIVRDTHNTAWKIHENKLKKDPGYVFKLLKTVGKKSTRNNDKPHIEEANSTKSSDPEKKRPNFRAVSKEQWSRWSLQMDACQFAERSLDECTNNWTKSITTTPPKEDKQGTSSIYKSTSTEIRKEIKRRQKEIVRDTHNTAWKIHENKLKKDPGYVFKLLKTVGKKSTRNNDKPHIIEEANGTKSSDPEKKTLPIWLKGIKKGDYAATITKPITISQVEEAIKRLKLNKAQSLDEISNDIISKSQFGFMKGRDTTEAVTKLFACTNNALSTDKNIHVTLLDIAKAYDTTITKPITISQVEEAIKRLKLNKAQSLDEISNEYLRNMNSIKVEELMIICNKILTAKRIPKAWKSSTTTLIFKGGDNKSNPLGYRPIAILSCAYKVFSQIITQRLYRWIEENDIISKSQFGFMKGRDTTEAVTKLFACTNNALSTDKNIHQESFGFMKGRDTTEAVTKLFACTNNALSTDKNIHTAYGLTDEISIEAGLRQGDIISPPLYLLFINPLIEWLEKNKSPYRLASLLVNLIAYADDLTLVAASGEGMEEAMKKVNDFCIHNNITINENKSSYHWLRGEPGDIKTRGTDIRKEGADGLFTILGWTTNLKMNWDEQIELLIQRFMSITNRALGEETYIESESGTYGLTDEISIEAGLRQGDIISPPLYLLFINPLIEWLEKNKSPYRLASLLVNLIAYADDLTLVAASGEGMEEAMKKVNDFCIHNNITINENKSSYHWLRGEPGDIKTRGTDIRKEGADGLFTILGWTTNLKMNWDEQIELLIQRFMSITNRALGEETYIESESGREWLIELDRWTMKKLNKLGGLDPHTDKAYWINFRGYRSLYSEATATLASLLVNLIAYADDLTLVAASGEGMEEAMKKVNDFCTHNNITINENKSSYHWLRGEPGDIKTRGTDIRKEGADGLFTILGWTTNLKMNWDEQIELLIQRFMSITNRALAEKKLTLNQKVEVINAIGLSTISYRAQHTMTDKGEWLIELDRWTIKKLNKLGGLDPHTDKAYVINFRGYHSLYSKATATYFGYLLDKTMNNPAVNINIRTAKAIEVEMTAKRFGLTLRANRTDTIDRIELLIQRFMSITNRALAEKKLTLNQKVEVINAIGLSTISYRAQHTMTDKGEWLIELDRWTMKKLNKLGGLDPHTDKAYWINFRGYCSLYSKATATYFGYLLDKTMNNPAVNINIRTAKAIEVEMTAKRFGLTLRANRTDTIDRVSTDTKTEKALQRYGILYIEQLIRESPEHLEICTDGSLYKGIASYGVAVIGHDEMNVGRRITGAQEINHAELRGILRAITHTGAAHNLTILRSLDPVE
ncbi:hypothetical protein PROFUN_15783 [Planoprotostelium fungivorum]|uniref:Reverse transcriptase domain-containing protein n=1 Tax=Planoprotostelium fungivorum TaxID=1890364 RepID=A0A2P6MT41_9EUKA|nr:hypothetical protein PROFUN_15783 [Planoprotostelium fungivorum]